MIEPLFVNGYVSATATAHLIDVCHINLCHIVSSNSITSVDVALLDNSKKHRAGTRTKQPDAFNHSGVKNNDGESVVSPAGECHRIE